VGRLWFAESHGTTSDCPIVACRVRTKEEVLVQAKRLTNDELIKRHRRALSEKRRFFSWTS